MREWETSRVQAIAAAEGSKGEQGGCEQPPGPGVLSLRHQLKAGVGLGFGYPKQEGQSPWTPPLSEVKQIAAACLRETGSFGAPRRDRSAQAGLGHGGSCGTRAGGTGIRNCCVPVTPSVMCRPPRPSLFSGGAFPRALFPGWHSAPSPADGVYSPKDA